MRIIALLFAFVLAGCTGNRLNAETKPTAVVLRAPPMAATFAAIRDGGHGDLSHGRGWRGLGPIADDPRRDAPKHRLRSPSPA
jgi:hypothetical protein